MCKEKCDLCDGSGISAKDSNGDPMKCGGCNGTGKIEEEVNPIFTKLSQHIGHAIECVGYGLNGDYINISIECVDCNEVIYDVEKYEEGDTGRGDIQ